MNKGIGRRLGKIYRFLILLIIVSLVLVTLIVHNISKEITSEDIKYIKKYMDRIEIDDSLNFSNYSETLSYEKQIDLIRKIQDNVLTISGEDEGIPHNKYRNPKDLFEAGEGLCYDRSYVLEKIFGSIGFQTRHLSLYEKIANHSVFKILTTPGVNSHAISEIKTKNGWLIVDSNEKWISLNKKNKPISMKELKRKKYTINWLYQYDDPSKDYYTEPYIFIYGLYSRHGKFFKPYNFIPDYKLEELMYNLSDE